MVRVRALQSCSDWLIELDRIPKKLPPIHIRVEQETRNLKLTGQVFRGFPFERLRYEISIGRVLSICRALELGAEEQSSRNPAFKSLDDIVPAVILFTWVYRPFGKRLMKQSVAPAIRNMLLGSFQIYSLLFPILTPR